MSSAPEFIDYICEQLEGLGDVRSRKMFGEYMVYLNDRPVLLVCDDLPYVKMLPCLEELLRDRPAASPYEGAKEHYVLDPDDRETLRRAAVLAEEVTPLPKKKTKKPKEADPEAQAGPVPWHVAWPAHMKPEPKDIDKWVDSPLYVRLQAWLAETYGLQPAIEFSRCSMDKGWNVKYKKGSRALCTLYPRVGHVTCMVSMGGKQLPDVEALLPTFSPEFQALYEKTALFNGGKWLLLDLKEPAHLEDVERLMLMKLKPAKKQM